MKTKPLVLGALVLTAVGVSAASGLLIGRISRGGAGVYERVASVSLGRAVAGGVAKAMVRLLSCRFS